MIAHKVAGDDKEYVHADEAADQMTGSYVERNHADDRNRSKPVDVRPVLQTSFLIQSCVHALLFSLSDSGCLVINIHQLDIINLRCIFIQKQAATIGAHLLVMRALRNAHRALRKRTGISWREAESGNSILYQFSTQPRSAARTGVPWQCLHHRTPECLKPHGWKHRNLAIAISHKPLPVTSIRDTERGRCWRRRNALGGHGAIANNLQLKWNCAAIPRQAVFEYLFPAIGGLMKSDISRFNSTGM